MEMYVQIMECLKRSCSMIIQDDFKPWDETEWNPDYGKVLLVDQADYNTQHIFFDDHADTNMDVRDLISGDKIPPRKYLNKYVVHVEPHRAVLESDYFVKMIEMCEARRDEEIERIEQGHESEEEGAVEEPNEWEKL